MGTHFHMTTSAGTLARFGTQRGPFQRWSILLRPQKAPRFTKVAALTESQKSRNPRFTRAKEKYENQHERQHQGKFPRSEGDNQRGGRKGHGRPQFESRRESRKEDGQSSTADRPC